MALCYIKYLASASHLLLLAIRQEREKKGERERDIRKYVRLTEQEGIVKGREGGQGDDRETD